MAAAALITPFLFLDLTFLGANLLKLVEGGWIPLAFGALVLIIIVMALNLIARVAGRIFAPKSGH